MSDASKDSQERADAEQRAGNIADLPATPVSEDEANAVKGGGTVQAATPAPPPKPRQPRTAQLIAPSAANRTVGRTRSLARSGRFGFVMLNFRLPPQINHRQDPGASAQARPDAASGR